MPWLASITEYLDSPVTLQTEPQRENNNALFHQYRTKESTHFFQTPFRTRYMWQRRAPLAVISVFAASTLIWKGSFQYWFFFFFFFLRSVFWMVLYLTLWNTATLLYPLVKWLLCHNCSPQCVCVCVCVCGWNITYPTHPNRTSLWASDLDRNNFDVRKLPSSQTVCVCKDLSVGMFRCLPVETVFVPVCGSVRWGDTAARARQNTRIAAKKKQKKKTVKTCTVKQIHAGCRSKSVFVVLTVVFVLGRKSLDNHDAGVGADSLVQITGFPLV